MSRSRKSLKRRISLYLVYSPFLRLVIFNRWFRAAFLAIFAGGIFLALFLPKIWTSSPEDFLPVVKVSGLDLTAARKLKKTAAEAEARKDYNHANYCWQSAIFRNGADATAIRGFLRNVLNLTDLDRRTVGVSYGQSTWLLRLEKTNALDVELCARVYEKFRWHDLIVQSFESQVDSLTLKARASYLKALFHVGRMEDFATHLEEWESKLTDPELPVYRRAYLAGWSSSVESTQALEELREAARQDRGFDRKALRLYMMVSARRADLDGYEQSLARLTAMNEAAVLDHLGFWQLLLAEGRKDEALNLAQAFSRPPTSAMETIQLARVYQALGLLDESLAVLKQHAPEFHFSPEVWATYARVLEKQEDWEGLRAVALQIRRTSTEGHMAGFSYFLEGRTELAHQRVPTAEGAFRKAAEAQYDHAAVGYMIARDLSNIKYFDFARTILKKIESSYAERPDYWQLAFDAAYALRDGEWLLAAARRLHEFNPSDIQTINRYAASLMVNRTRPEEAVKLTLEMTSRYPNSPTAIINHCFALLLNNRSDEAKTWLERINPDGLDPVESSAYHLALFELNYNLGHFTEAWSASDRIFTSQLFPAQLDWLAERKKEMPPRLTSVL